MQWGLAFSISAVYESDLWVLPPPSSKRRLTSKNGDVIMIFYHFQYAPQSPREWQRAAGIKEQIKQRVKSVKFNEYEPTEMEGHTYTVSSLGKHFKAFVKFPQPQFPSGQKEAYKMLCRHAKRLHYEGKLYLEQLIYVSMRFNAVEGNKEGPRQTFKRAISAYRFALENKDEWKVKLSEDALVLAHTKGASITNGVKKGVKILHSHIAKFMLDNGQDINTVCSVLSISRRTAYSYRSLLTP